MISKINITEFTERLNKNTKLGNPKNDEETEIVYEVLPIGFGYYWLKYMPIVGILIFNLIFYSQSAPLKVFQIMNPIMFSFIVFSSFYMWRKKSKLEADFKRIFEIE